MAEIEEENPTINDEESKERRIASSKNMSMLDIATSNDEEAIRGGYTFDSVISRNKEQVKSTTIDLIGERYDIIVEEIYHEKSSKYCKAFNARDRKKIEDNVYCLVFEKNFPVDAHLVEKLQYDTYDNHITPLEAEVVKLSLTMEEYFAIVFRKPNGIKLSDYLSSGRVFSEYVVNDEFIIPMYRLLKKFNEERITHTHINPENIYIDPDGHFVLDEFLSKVPGLYQPEIFEPLERVGMTPYAKGPGNSATDFYALGVVCMNMLLGDELFKRNVSVKDFTKKRFASGSYYSMIGYQSIPANIRDVVKGMTMDKQSDRWTIRQVDDWIKGNKYNHIPPKEHIEATRYILFNENHYFNRRALVVDLQEYWDVAKRYLKTETLTKWVERSVGDLKMSNKLKQLLRMRKVGRHKAFIDDNDLVTRTIIVLNPEGPLRNKDLTIAADGLPILIAYGYAVGKKDLLKQVAEIIMSGVIAIWADGKNNHHNYLIMQAVDRCRSFIESPSLGLGLERCLYELNPNLPCQSTALKGEYAVNIRDLLVSLNKAAEDPKTKVMDRHIAAFIANRIGLKSEVKIGSIANYPKFEEHGSVKALAILYAAQLETKAPTLTNITKSLAKWLEGVISQLNSNSLKAEMRDKIVEAGNNGDIAALYKAISDPFYIRNDIRGFNNAAYKYYNLEKQIMLSSDKLKISEIGYRYGLRLAVVASYLICTVVIIILMTRSLD